VPRGNKLALAPNPEHYQEAEALAERAPKPAVWHNVRFATAGWADRTLVHDSPFYPKAAKTPEARLRHYASEFSLVEVDATYYALLAAEIVARWVDWTDESFRFDVKAHPVVTGHPIEVERLPRDLKALCDAAGIGRRVYPEKLPNEIKLELEARFAASLEPLRANGRLAALFVQFPPWFASTRGNVRRLEDVAARWGALPLAVEFRHKSWLEESRRERVFALLRELEMSYVCVDEPPSRTGGLPNVVAVTNPRLAVVRFHGHNREAWDKKGASVLERFNYLYRPEELRAWVAPVRKLAAEAEAVHAVFNNCVRNYAVLNAKSLGFLVGEGAPGAA
jgi:uncharacterized protein YecE (DUF72 family)